MGGFDGQSLIVELWDHSRIHGRESAPVSDDDRAGGPDLNALLDRALPGGFRYLILLDPYDETVFNQRSMDFLIPELEQLREALRSDAERRMLERLLELANRCRDSHGSFLAFLGD